MQEIRTLKCFTFISKCNKMCFVVGHRPDPLGELTALLGLLQTPIAGLKGGGGGSGKREGGERREEGKGKDPSMSEVR